MEHIVNYAKLIGGGFLFWISYLFGGVDTALLFLAALMVLDVITGVMVGGLKKELTSKKSSLGMLKKFVILIIVATANIIGIYSGIDWIRGIVISFYIGNEALSVIENAAIMGAPIPTFLKEMLVQWRESADKGEKINKG